ncbi:MAG: L-threonylcarbamoyladenylate synthase [Rectinemataceae bacterium]
MELLQPDAQGIARAARALAEGLLVAIPTETVYGLGANAFDAAAVARVFEVKRRPGFDPLIVHIADIASLALVASFPNALAERLAEAFWPGPLTLILPKTSRVPALVTSGLDTVAVRMPAHPVARAIIRASGVPVAAPSANPFGYLSPTRAEHVVRMLGDAIDFVVDGGPTDIGVESTVLDVTGGRPLILRPGGLPRAAIEAVAGKVDLVDRASATPTSPGQLASHYAPRASLRLVAEGALSDACVGEGEGLVFFNEASRAAYNARRGSSGPTVSERILSPGGDLREAAAALFVVLHELDEAGVRGIWAERVPAEGLGLAVNDRLWKASTKQ